MESVSPVFLIALGFFVGVLGTLIGAGGGFILVPVLVFLFPQMPPEAITSISLGVVFLNASSGSIAYANMKRIDYKTAFIFSAATLPGSIIGAFSTSLIPKMLFDAALAVILMTISIFLIVKPRSLQQIGQLQKGRIVNRHLTDYVGEKYSYSFNLRLGILISFFVGFISSLLGIGGGIIHVPALTYLLHFPLHIATATSHFILAVMALAGTLVHIAQGTLRNSWQTMLLIGADVIVGAQLGARLSLKISARWITIAMAIALFFVGIGLLVSVV